MALTEKAKELRKDYLKKYRKEHREQINAYHRKWNKENPDKIKQYRENYWEKKLAEAEGKIEAEA